MSQPTLASHAVNDGDSPTEPTVTVPSVPSGGSVYVFLDVTGVAPPTSLTDSAGNTYTAVATGGPVGEDYLSVYAVDKAVGGTNVVVSAAGLTGTFYWVMIGVAFSGTASVSLDAGTPVISTSGSDTVDVTPAKAPLALLYVQIIDAAASDTLIFTPGGTDTLVNAGGDPDGVTSMAVSYRAETSTEATSMTMTNTDNDAPVIAIIVGVDATPPVTVVVTATPSSGDVPLTVDFTATASGGVSPYTYAWTFGDGGTSTEQNPDHTYTSVGTYKPSVTVTDSEGNTGVGSATVTVTNAPTGTGGSMLSGRQVQFG